MFIGNGWDLHKHTSSKPLIIGGLEFEEEEGFEAYSDGDILLHALSDALLGATGKKDLGYYFPSKKPTKKGIESTEILKKILEIIEYDQYRVNNIDIIRSISLSIIYFIFGVIIFYVSYFGAKNRGTLINMGE